MRTYWGSNKVRVIIDYNAETFHYHRRGLLGIEEESTFDIQHIDNNIHHI